MKPSPIAYGPATNSEKKLATIAAVSFFLFIAAIICVIVSAGAMSKANLEVQAREGTLSLDENVIVQVVDEPATCSVLLVAQAGSGVYATSDSVQLCEIGGAPVKATSYHGELEIVSSQDVGKGTELYIICDSQTDTCYAVTVSGSYSISITALEA